MLFAKTESGATSASRPERGGLRQGAKRALLSVMRHSGVFHLSSLKHRQSIPILCYHGAWMVDDGFPGDAMFIRPETFRARMQLIRDLGLAVIPLQQAVDALAGKGEAPENAIVITIDDGWFSTYRHMMPVLLEFGFPATLYADSAQLNRGGLVAHVLARYLPALTDWSEDMPADALAAHTEAATVENPPELKVPALHRFADMIGFDLAPYIEARAFEYMTLAEFKEFADAGFDIQLHTHNHTMGDLSPGDVGAELDANAAALANVTGRPSNSFKHFCYPSGVSDNPIADWLISRGIESATTTERGVAMPGNHLGLLPRLIDGDNVSDIEFEADVRGVVDTIKKPFST
jgi:peptidoglycan/xylan/chitin deacetylase (PgdA/CDA1 family)